jgi:hypothetical protein
MEKIKEKLAHHLGLSNEWKDGTYIYVLTRVKESRALGTMTIDDFVEINPEDAWYQNMVKDLATLIQESNEEVYKNVGSWYKVPIRQGMKSDYVGGLGKFKGGGCEVCGSKLVKIRGRNPQEKPRKVCPNCAVEIIEGILDKCNNRQAYTEIYLSSKETDNENN